MNVNILKTRDVYPMTVMNHIFPKKTPISIRIQEALFCNSWRNYSAIKLIVKFIERH